MTPAVAETEGEVAQSESQPIVNDLVLNVATQNGSGSQSANLILLRALFRMGIPVSGKNLFPSNIEGLPTWFSIRANDEGWLACKSQTDVMVCMNADTVDEDVAALPPGAVLIVPDTLRSRVTREDLIVYSVPFAQLVKEACPDTRLRKKIVNVIYTGVLARVIGIEMDEIRAAIDHQFGGKPKAAQLNKDAAQAGYDWAHNNLEEQHRFRVRRSNRTEGKIIIEGNEAAALGLLFGGITVLAWYPITPSSSLCETLAAYLEKYRRDPETGKATYAVVQAEDEMASIGIVVGAGWMGARAATATAGPGISLMAEMAGLSYFAEVPAVIIDVQRMGPSTGLPTRTSQGDILKAYHLSHGDCKHVLLIPGNVEECYRFAAEALELAEQLQTLVFVMSDLDLGMNKWMADPFGPLTAPLVRGKVLSKEDLDRVNGFERYKDVDGDGIPYRTLPGTEHPKAAFFTRGTGHNTRAGYSEKATDWQANMDRLRRKFDTARDLVPKPVLSEAPGAKFGLLAYGSSDPAVEEARHILADDHGLETNYLRVRALPPNGDVRAFLDRHDRVYVVDQNRDGQMATILMSEYPRYAARLRHVRHYNGLPIDALSIVEQVLDQEARKGGIA